ncbi:MAG: DUF4335 domain-containing protein [Leptolyngbyaceae cyanobacterium]
MTVKRQYILPNCNLIIEGLSAGDESDPNSPLTVVLNSECTFPGTTERLMGGREFLNGLTTSVNRYAQSLLSGIPYPDNDLSAQQPVTLKPTDSQRHRLEALVSEADGSETQKAVELNSVQLFDLVEAVDQLLADALTLPDMTPQLTSLNRRHARPVEPATKRLVPAAVGLSTLAASAALLFMVPVPEFEPEQRDEDELSELVESESENLAETSPDRPDSASDAAEPASDAPTTDSDLADSDPEPDDGDSELDAAAVDPVTAGIALGRLATAPAIADANQLDELDAELEALLEETLEDSDQGIPEELIYRVAVSEDVEILGYKYENDAALEHVDRTPLPDLTFVPINSDTVTDEPVAQFRVTFEPEGTITAELIDADDDE